MLFCAKCRRVIDSRSYVANVTCKEHAEHYVEHYHWKCRPEASTIIRIERMKCSTMLNRLAEMEMPFDTCSDRFCIDKTMKRRGGRKRSRPGIKPRKSRSWKMTKTKKKKK